MYNYKNLKPVRIVNDSGVECPILNCDNIVPKMKKGEDLNSNKDKIKKYKCNSHGIYISPSTFEYENYLDNLLWKETEDLNLLNDIMQPGVKRESRMARENSEDALTWNIFRYFDKINELTEIFNGIDNQTTKINDFIYWSYSKNERDVWKQLKEVRLEFGENGTKGSEPDLICITDKSIFFIEAKLTATNNTKPTNPIVENGYIKGGNQWFSQVFKQDFQSIAIEQEKYELLRFWLLGSWLANKYNKSFYLINVTPLYLEENIESLFKPLIVEKENRKFIRITWEQIYSYFSLKYRTNDEQLLEDYFMNKTLGYDSKGKLKKAFFNLSIV